MEYLIAIAALIAYALFRMLGSLAASEFRDYADIWTRRLIQLGVDKLPPERRERYAEEWRAHSDEIPGKALRLCDAITVYFKAGLVHSAPEVPRWDLDHLTIGCVFMFLGSTGEPIFQWINGAPLVILILSLIAPIIGLPLAIHVVRLRLKHGRYMPMSKETARTFGYNKD